MRRSFLLKKMGAAAQGPDADGISGTVLCIEYQATTNRMLRVAVNGFMETLELILGVMEDLDVDVMGI